ncbi:hypothetical protein [Flavobacterium sp.]|jgi:hypothetical protein|uniref:hypothetical protein n=1 Tax=Flavobacterium sp. TaxID=239 RepID=UPI0037C142BD
MINIFKTNLIFMASLCQLTFGQSYTVTPKSTNANGTTYEVKKKDDAYTNPKTAIDTQSAQHLQNTQNNISSSVNNVANSLSASMSAQMNQAGFVYLGKGAYKVTEVGSSGFVGTKRLVERANEGISNFTTKIGKKYLINSTEIFKQSFGVLPKAVVVFTLVDENNNPILTVEENIKRSNELSDKFKKIKTDILMNNDSKYKSIVIDNIIGWMPEENKKEIIKILEKSNKFKVITDKTNMLESDNKATEYLFLNMNREAIGEYSRLTYLTIKDNDNQIIYDGEFKNISSEDILLPLTIPEYKYTKEAAIEKVKEMKQLLDLGVITKEEYDLKVLELKPILMGNN